MSMLYRSPDGSFIIYNTVNSIAPAKCLHVQPGVINFPGRCVLPPNHYGRRHEGGIQWRPNGESMEPEVWGDDDA